MKNPVSNIFAATLFVFVVILSRLPNLVVALMFFSIALWPVRFSFIPDNPLGNLTGLPLCKRGIEGDFCVPATLKSPLAPLLQRGECVVIARIRSNGLSGFIYQSSFVNQKI